MSSAPGEIHSALKAGYRITVHKDDFPFVPHFSTDKTPIHAVVDHGARAIFCSQEWFEKLPKGAA